LALALMPFGLESIALVPLGWGVDLIIWTAVTVAAWPGAVLPVRVIPDFGLALMVLGGLWLCLWQERWRRWAVLPIAIGVLSPLVSPLPDVLVSGDGRAWAVRLGDGRLAAWSERGNRFAIETWSRRNGQLAPAPWPGAMEDTGERSLRCDRLGCVYQAMGRAAALVRDPAALAEDCTVADAVISAVPVRRQCRNLPVVIDRFDLWREGAHALWLGPRLRVESVRARRGERPWVLAPPGRRR